VDGSSGLLTQQDYFEPFDYNNLNGGDRDMASSGVALLESGTFSGGGVNRIAISAGKNGKVSEEPGLIINGEEHWLRSWH
jgi:hypothetical protein